MVNDLIWCCNKKDGINLINPNENLAKGYIKMAEDALGTMNREKNLNIQFSISACYYSMYYSLYSILMKIGIKSEIHKCTLEFMKKMLSGFYSEQDVRLINKAFELRNISQYYIDKVVSKKEAEFVISEAPNFFNTSKQIIMKLNEKDINSIRQEIKSMKEEIK